MNNTKIPNNDVQFFDRWAPTYDRNIMNIFIDRIHHILLDQAVQANHSQPPENVIDVGCGTGRLLRGAKKRWPEAYLIGIDPSWGMLEVARQRTPGATFFNGSAESLPFPDDSADLVVSTLSFHHWSNQEAGLIEIARVLRPGGRFCLGDLGLPTYLAWLTHHVDGNNPATWRSLFDQAGFELLSINRQMTGFLLVAVSEKPSSKTMGSPGGLSLH
jgi:ubiquinone/menaquinone biosynthesis C-methylase UbiE